MDNKYMNEMLSEALGTKNADAAAAQEPTTEQQEKAPVEQTEATATETQSNEQTSVEQTEQTTNEEPKQEPAAEETAVQETTEQTNAEQKAWYDSNGEEQAVSQVDYTDKLKELKIDLENPESIVKAVELASNPELPAEFNSEVVKEFAKYIKEGGDIKEFMDTYVATDVTKLSDREVFSSYLNGMGVESGDMEKALKDFDEMPKYQQKLQTQRLRGELEVAQRAKLSELSSRQESVAHEQQKQLEQLQRNVETSVEDLVGKSYKGLKIDGNMAKAIKNELINNFTFQKKDGSPDINKLIDFAVWQRYGADLVKANVTQATNNGREQVLDKLGNPSSNPAPSNVQTGQKTATDFLGDYINRGLLRNRK